MKLLCSKLCQHIVPRPSPDRGSSNTIHHSNDCRVLDVEPECDEDEDTIIERRRQLCQAIVNKYHQPGPTTPQASRPTTPPSEVDSETVIEERIEEVLEEEKKEEEGRQEGVGVEGQEGSTSGLVKKDTGEEVKVQEELMKKKTSLSALRDAIRNGMLFVTGTCSVRKTSSQRW